MLFFFGLCADENLEIVGKWRCRFAFVLLCLMWEWMTDSMVIKWRAYASAVSIDSQQENVKSSWSQFTMWIRINSNKNFENLKYIIKNATPKKQKLHRI